jgi:hypothetical protein
LHLSTNKSFPADLPTSPAYLTMHYILQ